MKPSGTELKREAAAWNTGGRYVGEHYPDRWQSCQGGPASGGTGGQDRLGQRTERKVTRGLRGCCSRSSQASRSTYTRHTPMPVSHPLGWEEPVSCSRENGNIQVQETSHQVQETSHPAWQHVFFGSEHTAPTLRQAAHSRGADAPPKRFQRGAPRQDNKQLRRAPWQKTSSQNLPLGEESTEQKDHAYSSKYWSHPLAQNILPSIIQNQADEVKSQNILHFLHPNPVRIPQDWTLEKTVFPQGSSSYNNRFDSKIRWIQ